jgi:hypothetical protein
MKSLIFTAESIRGLQRALRGEPGGKFQTRRKIGKREMAAWQSCGGELADGVPVLEDEYGDPINLADILPIQPGDVVRAKEAFGCHWAEGRLNYSIQYRADDIGSPQKIVQPQASLESGLSRVWCSPMYMPVVASRYFLPITAVRCERLQDITEADAVAEGVEPLFSQAEIHMPRYRGELDLQPMPYKNYLWHGVRGVKREIIEGWSCQFSSYTSARDSYSSLFEAINGKGSWAANPWVAVNQWTAVLTEATGAKS